MTSQTLPNSPLADTLLAASERTTAPGTPLAGLRREALHRFEALGFPSTRHEEWKYTSLKTLVAQAFTPDAPEQLAAAHLQGILIEDEGASSLVFVNGRYRADLSHITADPAAPEALVMPFSEALARHPERVSQHFARYAAYQHESLTALNTALAQEGLFVHAPDGYVFQKPVYAYFLNDARQEAPATHLRTLVVAGRNAGAKVVTVYRTLGEHRSFTNAVAEVVAGRNASVEYYLLQNETEQAHLITNTQAHLVHDAHFTAHTLSLNGGLIRNNLNLALDGSNVDAHMYGLYLLAGRSHVDNHTLVDHRQPHSQSNELYKGILDGRSTGVFNGKIFVKPDAQKTNAFQSNRNLVLSKEASINTKPQLEIFADDVKCSHGATVGQLDDEMLFYLRSRGIGFEQARALLMRAFADDVLHHISIGAVRGHVDGWIGERL